MFDDMHSTIDTMHRRCSLPVLNPFSPKESNASSDVSEDRRLPPLPRVEPGPPGPLGPFINPFTPTIFAPSPSSSQDSFSVKSPWPVHESVMAPPSPANSAESSWQESLPSTKAGDWPTDLSPSEMMALIAPRNINRKPPLQQICGRKRKGSLLCSDPDDQREKHRIAEGNRRKNLSQLHRELDSRIHDYFLERAGWNPAKSLPESKEHIVQGAIFLIDFMLLIIVHLIRQENEMPRQLSDKLQPQIRCMQLQQLVSTLQQQQQTSQQQIQALKQENDKLIERNKALEFQLSSYEHLFRSSPKSEPTTSSNPLSQPPEKRQKTMLPGLHALCDGVDVITHHQETAPPADSFGTNPCQTYFPNSFLRTTPPMTGPSSPILLHPPQSAPMSRCGSLVSSP
ncbi:hypothetical protein ASPZODRAFT_731428 [Penicilliopsis zonata CBS 506.65]|uniref:Uncharacterized protein n=1 Tax=Penicilliopsis zonata CBS 506.65 TaxID=1073090 RepID=A0A1L9SC78_9EURO|nr:hypothetical protein ASPZODRAFT_731428 [Penicilliopsis zonata CBS 506.65]OJJ44753.1 hypothetical protein ASPZODRAFT_731428 [Penicilliopsis zonata CBS 506.65]